MCMSFECRQKVFEGSEGRHRRICGGAVLYVGPEGGKGRAGCCYTSTSTVGVVVGIKCENVLLNNGCDRSNIIGDGGGVGLVVVTW